jgi:hypothetical protein
MQKITDQEVLDVLRAMTCEGDLAVLNSGQLERKLYEKVNKVLAALGGKWNRGRPTPYTSCKPTSTCGPAACWSL